MVPRQLFQRVLSRLEGAFWKATQTERVEEVHILQSRLNWTALTGLCYLGLFAISKPFDLLNPLKKADK